MNCMNFTESKQRGDRPKRKTFRRLFAQGAFKKPGAISLTPRFSEVWRLLHTVSTILRVFPVRAGISRILERTLLFAPLSVIAAVATLAAGCGQKDPGAAAGAASEKVAAWRVKRGTHGEVTLALDAKTQEIMGL